MGNLALTPRFAIVGTGRMAASMAATFRARGIGIAAVASRDPLRAQRFANENGVAHACEDWTQLLERPDVDAVYIATHPGEHAAIAAASLEAGKAVLCEKPLATDEESGRIVAEAARRTGVLCMEGLWTAFLPAHRKFFQLADSGACGTPVHLTASFGYPETEAAPCRSAAAGGVLLDRAVYLAALALRAMGPVAKVAAELDVGADGVERTASLTLLHANGAQSQLAASFVAEMSNTAVLTGTSGSITLKKPLLGSERLAFRKLEARQGGENRGHASPLRQWFRQAPALRRLKRVLDDRSEHLAYGSDPYMPQLDHFVSLLRSGERESPIMPLRLSLDALRVLDQARRAESLLRPRRMRA